MSYRSEIFLVNFEEIPRIARSAHSIVDFEQVNDDLVNTSKSFA